MCKVRLYVYNMSICVLYVSFMPHFSSSMFEITLSGRSRCNIVLSFHGEGREFGKGTKQKGDRIEARKSEKNYQ